MNDFIPLTLKYQLQTFSPSHWATEYRNRPQQEISGAIEILKKLPEKSHLYPLAQKAIEVLSSPNSTPVQIPSSAKKQMTLHEACKQGDFPAVEQLLESGVYINGRNRQGNNPLLMLCQEGLHEDLCLFLIEKRINIYAVGNDKKTALYHAVENGQYRVANRLIEKGVNPQEILDFDTYKLLPLEEGISLFKEKHPDYDLSRAFEDRDMIIQIMHLEKTAKTAVIKKLVDAGADVNIRLDDQGHTPLHAIMHPEIIEAFIDAGADIHIKNREGKTAFDLAVKETSPDCPADEAASPEFLYLFLRKDPSLLDTAKLDTKTLTDLMRFACRDNCEELALKLLARGVRVDIPDSNKFTALDLALVKGHFDLIKTITQQLDGSYKTFIEHKFFAHVFGLNGFSDLGIFKGGHEGFNYLLSAQMLALYGGMFLKDNPEMQELFEAIQEAPGNCTCRAEELVKKIEAGKMVILFTGWDEHITALIFYNGYVLKCNRGSGSGTEAGVEIFQMEDKENLPSVLSDLQRFSTSREGQDLFCTQINDRLKLKKLGTMHLKDQPVGNCGWSTAKAVFLGASFLHHLKQELPENQALVEGMRLFKAFTPFVREKVFEYCVSSTKGMEGFG